MIFCAARFIAIIGFISSATLGGQPADLLGTRRFEVVSIRRVPPNGPPRMIPAGFTPVLPGGRYVDSSAGLFSMIAFAYNIGDASNRLVGLPSWAKDERFAVAAKSAEDFPALPVAQNAEQVRIMLRAMLAERFRLKLHTALRVGRVYVMKTVKQGIKITEVAPPSPEEKEGHVEMALDDAYGRMIGKKVTTASMTEALAIFLKRPILDQTGLKGFYTFDISWNEEVPQDNHGGLGPTGITLLMTSLRNRLGLELESSKAPLEYWIIDQVEMPTEN